VRVGDGETQDDNDKPSSSVRQAMRLLYSDSEHAAARTIEATIPVGSSSSQTSDIQPAAAEVASASQNSNGNTATRRNPVQEAQDA
jgi:hypothetical protein